MMFRLLLVLMFIIEVWLLLDPDSYFYIEGDFWKEVITEEERECHFIHSSCGSEMSQPAAGSAGSWLPRK